MCPTWVSYERKATTSGVHGNIGGRHSRSPVVLLWNVASPDHAVATWWYHSASSLTRTSMLLSGGNGRWSLPPLLKTLCWACPVHLRKLEDSNRYSASRSPRSPEFGFGCCLVPWKITMVWMESSHFGYRVLTRGRRKTASRMWSWRAQFAVALTCLNTPIVTVHTSPISYGALGQRRNTIFSRSNTG